MMFEPLVVTQKVRLKKVLNQDSKKVPTQDSKKVLIRIQKKASHLGLKYSYSLGIVLLNP